MKLVAVVVVAVRVMIMAVKFWDSKYICGYE